MAVLGLFLALLAGGAGAAEPEGWSVGGSYRVRFESLDGAFRRGTVGSDQILAERLLLAVQFDGGSWYAGAELQDSRAQLSDRGTPLGTDDVNTLEPLQAYVGVRRAGAADGRGALDLRLGRMTMDLGNRRLVARNRFRNTSNAFTGLRGDWQADADTRISAFLTTPIQRLPVLPERLRDNEQELDDEDFDDRFWGLWLSRSGWPGGGSTDLYVLGLRERRLVDRDLYTGGLRLVLPDAIGQWELEAEAAWQWGTSRDLTVNPLRDLDHRAGFLHLSLARALGLPWQSTLVLQADAASGDRDPDDGRHERFDTLFGARRSEFGPTGIYGLLARSNLLSPGLRLELEPRPGISIDAGYRAAFLASDRDLLATALLRDPAGDSGDFIGHQVETRLRYAPGAGTLQFEAGGVWLDQGRFLTDAPGAVGTGRTIYGYLEASVRF